MPMYADACMKHVYTSLEGAHAYVCMSAHALGLHWPFFSKKEEAYFSLEKSYIFPKTLSASQFQSD